MTSHVAVSSQDFVIAFSDSQGTVGMESEIHGGQKLFFGSDFLVAKAGSNLVSNPLFSLLREQTASGDVTSSNLQQVIKKYLEDEVRPHLWNEVQFLTATPCTDGNWIQTYMPEVFLNFGARSQFSAIGSGETFVQRMLDRLENLQCPWSSLSLAGTYCVTKRLADAANESLTVDDTHLVGLIVNGRSYAMGDQQIRPFYLEEPIRQHWQSIGKRFEKISAIAETANSTINNAFRSIRGVWTGSVEVSDAAIPIQSAAQVATEYDRLEKELHDYFAWYDGLLGRS